MKKLLIFLGAGFLLYVLISFLVNKFAPDTNLVFLVAITSPMKGVADSLRDVFQSFSSSIP